MVTSGVCAAHALRPLARAMSPAVELEDDGVLCLHHGGEPEQLALEELTDASLLSPTLEVASQESQHGSGYHVSLTGGGEAPVSPGCHGLRAAGARRCPATPSRSGRHTARDSSRRVGPDARPGPMPTAGLPRGSDEVGSIPTPRCPRGKTVAVRDRPRRERAWGPSSSHRRYHVTLTPAPADRSGPALEPRASPKTKAPRLSVTLAPPSSRASGPPRALQAPSASR